MELNIQNKIDIIKKVVSDFSYVYVEIDQSAVDCIYDFYVIITNSNDATVIQNISSYSNIMLARSHLSIVCLYIGFFCEVRSNSALGYKISRCYYKLAVEYGNVRAMANLGNNYYGRNQFDKALSYYKSCLKNDHPNLKYVYNRIAKTYYATKEYTKSLKYYKHQLNVILKHFRLGESTDWFLGEEYDNINSACLKLGLNYEVEFFEMFQREENCIFGLSHFNTAWFNQKRGNKDVAIYSYELALRDHFANPIEIYERLASMYYKKKDYVNSLRYYKKLFINGKISFAITICIINSEIKNNLKSLKYFKKCYELSFFSEAISLSSLLQILQNNKNYDCLIQYYIYEKSVTDFSICYLQSQ